jgi:hypothetical protein
VPVVSASVRYHRGAAVIAVAGTLAAIASAVLGVATAAFTHSVSGRTALCAFFVVGLVVPILTHRSVQNYRGGVWHPGLTAVATTPAAVPDAIGPVRYRIPLAADVHSTIYAAGIVIASWRDRRGCCATYVHRTLVVLLRSNSDVC